MQLEFPMCFEDGIKINLEMHNSYGVFRLQGGSSIYFKNIEYLSYSMIETQVENNRSLKKKSYMKIAGSVKYE